MPERTTQERLEKLVLHRDLIIEQANLKGANIPLNSDYPAIIAGIESITTGLNPTEVETLLDDILGEVIVGDYTAKGQAILDKIADVLSSIESKGVVVPVDAELTDCPALIDSIQTGGGTDGHKVVTYDYDGITILKTEYVQDGQDGTPPNDPNHAYLVLSGYHGSYVNVTEDRDIYALYTTIDDVTVLFFRLPKSVNSITLNVTSYHVDGFTYAFNGDTAVTVAGSGNKQINRTLTAGVTHTLVLGKVSANSSIKLGRPASYQNCIPLGQLAINTLIKVYFGNNCGIESYCFSNSHSLKTIVLNSSIVEIPSGSLYNNYSLMALVIPNVSALNSELVSCKALRKVVGNSISTSVGSLFSGCYSLKEIKLSFSTMPTYSPLNNCYQLEEFVYPNFVTVTYGEFYTNYSLRRVVLPQGLLTLGQNTFRNCHNLEYLDIPASVTTLEMYAINSCTRLQYIIFRGTVPPTTGANNLYGNNPSMEIFVPDTSLDAYKTTQNLTDWANNMRALSEFNADNYK